jgi:hypothetical protein
MHIKKSIQDPKHETAQQQQQKHKTHNITTTPRHTGLLKFMCCFLLGGGSEYLYLKVYVSAKNLKIVKAAIVKGITCKREVGSRHGIRIENMYATPAP